MLNVQIPLEKINFEIICHPEELHPKDCFCYGDDEQSIKDEAEDVNTILNELLYTQWAWCVVEVKGEWEGINTSDFLGAVNCKSAEDFMENCGYYQDMQLVVKKELEEILNDILTKVKELED